MRQLFLVGLTCLILAAPLGAQTREEKVRNDRKKVEGEGFWIYNDLPKGFAEAKKTGKPMLVILRCIPCEACVKLDDDLVNQDKRVRPLLEQFVRVRIVSTNGLDLSLFQFDYDQSFAAFLFNADRTIYGRFGTRSHRTSWSDDVSIEGLAQALQGALYLHREYPKNKKALAGKTGPAPAAAAPEKYPMLRDRYGPTLDYKGKVVQSCIHCHQIGDAARFDYLSGKKPMPESVLFPYPHPRVVGLTLDPKTSAKVLAVAPGSAAEKAGFRQGDQLLRLNGQPMLSIADVQWVLHHAGADGATLEAVVKRAGKSLDLKLTLSAGWRRKDDLDWRVSSWQLRRYAAGGMKLDPLTAKERGEEKLPAEGMALKVRFVGNFPQHNGARKAGFLVNDILVSFNGRTDLMRETDLFRHVLLERKDNTPIPVDLIRAGKKVKLMLSLQ